MVSNFQFCAAYVIVDALCFVLTVIISSNVSRDAGSERQVRYFFMLLTSNMIFVIFDAVWAILVIGGVIEPTELLLSVVNGINLTAIAFTGYFWFAFSLAYFGKRIAGSRLLLLPAIPAALVPVFHAIGYFIGQNVIFMPDGTVAYGFMHTIVAIVPMLYLLASTVVAVNEYRNASTSAQRRMYLAFVLFMVAPAASGVIDMFIPNMPVVAACIIISITLVMMSMQESRISSDALTGLNNRRRAEAFLEDEMSHASADRPVRLFIIDMNHFKAINDTYGHLEGDHALQLMAESLRDVCSQTNAFACRWGGDEFAVIATRQTPQDPDTITTLIKRTLQEKAHDAQVPYKLECSVGYASCESESEQLNALVARADEMLYQNKYR